MVDGIRVKDYQGSNNTVSVWYLFEHVECEDCGITLKVEYPLITNIVIETE